MKRQFAEFVATMLALMVIMTSVPGVSIRAVEANESEDTVRIANVAQETVSESDIEEDVDDEEDPDDEEETYTCTLDENGVLTIEGTGYISGVGVEDEALVKSVIIKDGITGISIRTFENFVNLETISIPNSVTELGEKVFSGCSSLKTVKLPDNILAVNFGTFAGCTGLTSVTLPKNLEIISGYVFDNCSNLASITIPDGVTVIFDGAFRNCSKLTNIKIPNGVESIRSNVFFGCNIKSLEIPLSVTNIDVSAFNKAQIEDIYYAGSEEQWKVAFPLEAFLEEVKAEEGDISEYENYWSLTTEIHYNATMSHVHTSSDWIVTKAATEDAVGTKVKKCTGCGQVLETAEIEKLPCSHKESKWVVTTEATAKKAGLKEQKCSKCGIVLASEKLPAFKVTLNAKKVSIQQGKSSTAVKATVMKGDKVKSWKSSNKKVATVNSKGKITAKKAGTATITVTTKKGAKATVKVTVQKKAVKCTKLTADKKKLTLKVKKSYQLKVTKTPVTTLEKVTYQSSNKKVATVNSKGKITAKKAGKATITIKCGKKSVKVKVTVKKK